jgi:WD40 repeat protein
MIVAASALVLSQPVGGTTAESAAATSAIAPGLLLVSTPARIEGVERWTIETRRCRADLRVLAFSRDERSLAVAGDAGVIRIFEVATGDLRKILIGHGGSIRGLAFLPDDKTLASVSRDQTVRFWETETGRTIRTITVGASINAAAFSPDGWRLVTVGPNGDARLWDTATGKATGVLGGHRADVTLAAWSPDGLRIATADAGGKVGVWDASTKRSIATIDRGVKRVGALAWSPDTSMLAFSEAGRESRGLFVWDGKTKSVIRMIREDVGPSGIVAWSPDGRELACQGEDQHVNVWDTRSWRLSRQLSLGNFPPVRCGAWSPGGQYLATCGSGIEASSLWLGVAVGSAASGKAVWKSERFHAQLVAAALSPDARWLAASCKGGGFGFRIWDLPSGALRTEVARLEGVPVLSWSPDSRTLATSRPEGGGVSLWDAEGGDRVRDCQYPEGGGVARCIAWSPDGKRLVSAPEIGGMPTVFDSVTGRPLGQLKGGGPSDAAWSPNGKLIALPYRSEGKGAGLWNAFSGDFVMAAEGPGEDQSGLAWSADSRRLVCGGLDGKPLVWVLGRASKAGLLPSSGSPVPVVTWSPDGKMIAAGEALAAADLAASVLLWNGRSGRSLPALEGHPSSIHSLGWSKDGTLLFSACHRFVRLWNPSSGQSAMTVVPMGPHTSLAISGEGHFRANGQFDPSAEVVYIAATADGQETMAPDDFARRYGWRNDPAKAVCQRVDSESAKKPSQHPSR